VSASPRVTVLMPVHNGARYVDEAIGSILRQTFTDFEFLIVDDGSTDETPRRLTAFRDPRIRIIRNEKNIGLTRSLNLGLGLATGALIARQDADDVAHKGRLQAQVDSLERTPDVVVLGTQARYISSRGRPKGVAPWPKSTSNLAIRWQLLFDGPLIHTSVMFRKAIIWDELGGYDESFVTSQDFELWSRVSARGYPMQNLPVALVDHRVHDGSVSRRPRIETITKLRALFLANLVSQLGPAEVPADWPDAWIRFYFPDAFSDGADPVPAILRAMHQIHRRFAEVNPDAARDPDIRRHIAAIQIRMANYAAARRWTRSFRPFARACSLEPVMAAHAVPRYAGHLLLRGCRYMAMPLAKRAGRH
jgi:glycosyltransferase involved in cell wall biosynthesis